jgi:malate synthase
MEVFDQALGAKPHQKERLREDVQVKAQDLTYIRVPGGKVTEAGLRLNVNVALQYVESWLGGNGAAAINNLMEDAATAEISRAQIWQWIRHGTKLEDGRQITRELYAQIRGEELARLGGPATGRYREAAEILDGLITSDTFAEFLTIPAYAYLE